MKHLDSVQNSLLANDIQGLDRLRQQGFEQDRGKALDEAARQFESLFTQQLFKSMREANQVFEADSPMNSRYTQFYQDMHDQQMSSELSRQGSLGLADLIVRQLGGQEDEAATEVRHFSLENVRRIQGKVVRPPDAGSDGEAADAVRPPLKAAQNTLEHAVTLAAGQKFESPKDFVRRLLPAATAAAERLGLDPKAMVAQAALETGWGKKIIGKKNGESSHNLFGIKADNSWKAQKTWVNTLEYEQGIAVQVRAPFRSYASFDDSFNDYVRFLNDNPRYGQALQQTGSPRQYFQALQQAGYATDPNYASKLSAVLDTVDRLASQA
ncbi:MULTISPECIES: flagellar assembly peptidoglycan hydrolase FlgJ [Oceanimonas]|uniref:Peptidoglycan hydrolase FlgJ n=1 Tax=Oceanimonas doudoroffii TaxID=84158 RepID=A0A233RIR6_9GAMM|nr:MULTISPECIES: flagellar assembly peptidoglycan hydrolase FlgJ [Oceanimonas]NHI00124.1 Peptidoglycan hydrolase FlgJ [Oceanimonas sp. MB9]OXY83279.1 flagellar assembly peptidoglycan hydrolase FlgJ [Oceanimonas doudoroffii]